MARKRKLPSMNSTFLLGVTRVTANLLRTVIASLPDEVVSEENKKKFRYDLDYGEILDENLACTLELPLENGGTYSWVIARPQGVVQKFAAESATYRRILKSAPSSFDQPFHVVHYTDEVSSGNLLAPNTSRKFAAFRFTFMEFGQRLLSCQHLWAEYGPRLKSAPPTPLPSQACAPQCPRSGAPGPPARPEPGHRAPWIRARAEVLEVVRVCLCQSCIRRLAEQCATSSCWRHVVHIQDAARCVFQRP